MRRTYTFDEVALVPQFNNIPSRTEPSLQTWLSRDRRVDIPLVASNMDSVIGEQLAEVLLANGTLPIYHRFTDEAGQSAWVRRFRDRTFISCGMKDIDAVRALLDLGAVGVCVDIAHGHSEHALEGGHRCKDAYPDINLIAGNVATAAGAVDLADAGADAIKVGVGPGGVCITRQVTGVGVPQLTALQDVFQAGVDVPIIADGGIRSAGDIAKALAAGADSVMLGSLLAGTKESPGDVEQTNYGLVKRFRGMASREAVEGRAQRRGEALDAEYFEARSPEGVESTVPYKGTVDKIVKSLMGGVKSAFSYLNAENLAEFRANAAFIRVSPAGLQEGMPHIDGV